MLNKEIFQALHFRYATCLTTLHFFFNYLACETLIFGGKIKRKWLPWRQAVPMGMTWCASIVFANLSLLHNSTGFYQAMKLLGAPMLVVFQQVLYGMHTHRREKIALIPLIIGVGLITVNDMYFSATGTVYAVIQLLSAATVQTWVNTKQKEHNMDASQLLHNNAFVCFAVLGPLAPLIDYANTSDWVFDETFSTRLISVCLFSGLVAFGLNMACFMIIGHSGAIVFQVVGYLKTILVFMGGSFFFLEVFTPRKIIGVVISLMGLAWYTRVKQMLKKDSLGEYKPVNTRDDVLSLEEEKEVDALLANMVTEDGDDLEEGSIELTDSLTVSPTKRGGY